MFDPYDIYFWSKDYREEALREVQTRRLAEQARTNRRGAVGARVRLAWASLTSLLLAALEEYDAGTSRRP